MRKELTVREAVIKVLLAEGHPLTTADLIREIQKVRKPNIHKGRPPSEKTHYNLVDRVVQSSRLEFFHIGSYVCLSSWGPKTFVDWIHRLKESWEVEARQATNKEQ